MRKYLYLFVPTTAAILGYYLYASELRTPEDVFFGVAIGPLAVYFLIVGLGMIFFPKKRRITAKSARIREKIRKIAYVLIGVGNVIGVALAVFELPRADGFGALVLFVWVVFMLIVSSLLIAFVSMFFSESDAKERVHDFWFGVLCFLLIVFVVRVPTVLQERSAQKMLRDVSNQEWASTYFGNMQERTELPIGASRDDLALLVDSHFQQTLPEPRDKRFELEEIRNVPWPGDDMVTEDQKRRNRYLIGKWFAFRALEKCMPDIEYYLLGSKGITNEFYAFSGDSLVYSYFQYESNNERPVWMVKDNFAHIRSDAVMTSPDDVDTLLICGQSHSRAFMNPMIKVEDGEVLMLSRYYDLDKQDQLSLQQREDLQSLVDEYVRIGVDAFEEKYRWD